MLLIGGNLYDRSKRIVRHSIGTKSDRTEMTKPGPIANDPESVNEPIRITAIQHEVNATMMPTATARRTAFGPGPRTVHMIMMTKPMTKANANGNPALIC